MALADFIQALQEEDVVYSEPRQSLKKNDVSKMNETATQLESEIVSEPPKTIKLKLRKKPVDLNVQPALSSSETKSTSEKNRNIISDKPESSSKDVKNEIEISQKSSEEFVQEKTNLEKPIISKEPTDEEIFMSTGTEDSKKDLWFQYFNQAKNSRKKNPIVERMKIGRFTITPDNKVLLLPDYDIVGKDPDDVLKDKWF